MGRFIFLNRKNQQISKTILVATIILNLSLLCVFKYTNFFISTFNYLGAHVNFFEIVLPLGISFFTFTQIAYLVDVFEGEANEYDFVSYLLFVTWFPHLIAGPVLHHQQMIPQFNSDSTYKFNYHSVVTGLTLFSIGLFKKVVLADQYALYATPIFDQAFDGGQPMLLGAWIGALAYTLQLYFDFSGYSDMAIGLSMLFNIWLPINFESPYKARNIIDFWRRWHITLSNFLRDYLYYPLGGNKKGLFRRHLNLFATMLLGGLWHGSGWNFVLWGMIHGVYLIFNHLYRGLFPYRPENKNSLLASSIGVLATFTAVVIAWVPFRAASITATLQIWRGMIGLNGVSLPESLKSSLGGISNQVNFLGVLPGQAISSFEVFSWLGIGLLIIWTMPNSQFLIEKFSLRLRTRNVNSFYEMQSLVMVIYAGILFSISILSLKKASEFLYFQF